MPTVPKLREVQVAPIGTPFQTAAGATPAAFGAREGAALEGLGRGLSQVGEAVNQIAVKQQIEESERIAKELDVAFTRRKREMLYAEDGLYNLQGANAVGQSPAFKQRIHDLREELTREVTNERAKRLFNQTAAVRTEREFLTIDGFVSKERKVAFQVASEARVKEAIDDAVTSGGDPTQLARSTAIISGEIHEQAEAQGWAPEVTVSKLEEARTALLKNVIVGHVKSGQTARAREFLTEHKSEMDGPVAAQMEELVREADDIAEAQTAVDTIFTDPNLDTAEKRLSAARELPAGNLRLRAVQLTKVRNKEAADQLSAQLTAIEGDAAQAIAAGASLDDWALENPIHFMALTRDTKAMKRLRDAEIATAENRDYALTTDPEVFAAVAGLSPEKLAKVTDEQMQQARLSLTHEDWEQVVLMRKAARNSLDETSDSFATLNDITGMMKNWAHPDLRWNDPKASDALQLQQRQMMTEMLGWAQRKLDRGEKITAEESVRKFLSVQQEAVDYDRYLGIFDSTALGIEVAAMEPQEREQYEVDIDDVAPSYRAVVTGTFSRYGVTDPTDQEIAALITGEVRKDSTYQVNVIRAAQAARETKKQPTRSPTPQSLQTDKVLRNEARNQAAPTSVGSLESAIIPPVEAPATETPEVVGIVPEEVMANVPEDKLDRIPRGVRNNNPGNIRLSTTEWEGETEGVDDAFETFQSPEMGIRAVQKIVNTYRQKYNLKTVYDIIARWAPPSENDTDAYANFVAQAVGVRSDEPINTNNVDVATKLVSAIITFENGFNPYPEEMVRRGVELGLK